MTLINHADIMNKLLRSIEKNDFERLAAVSTLVDLGKNQELAAPWKFLDLCWFPLSGIVCSLVSDALGEQAAVCLIGREGLVDASVVLGDSVSSTQMLVMVPGQALRLTRFALADVLRSGPTLSTALLSYVRYESIQSEAITLAAARRSLASRLASFLLMCSDRTNGSAIWITHWELALMLCVRRAGVTVALSGLSTAGIIQSGRSTIEILNRGELLAVAGGSYGDAENAYRRLIGPLNSRVVA